MFQNHFKDFDQSTPIDFFKKLFSADFMPHGHCYFWKPEIVWLHVISDFLIGIAYYSIPLLLLYFLKKRRDVPFHWIFALFAAFIFWCGTTHFFNILTLWIPVYRLDGVIKAITAAISLYTVFVLIPVIPKALTLRSSEELQAINARLQKEISENLEVQQKLVKSEEKFRLLVSGVRDYAVYLLNPDGIISSWNEGAQRIKGYEAHEIIGKNFSMFYSPEEIANHKPKNDLDAALKLGKWEEETIRRRKDGTLFHAKITISPLYDQNNKFYGFGKITQDITERKEAEKSLKEAHDNLEERIEERTEEIVRINEDLFRSNAELQQFAYVASHDLQEPLRTVSVYLQLLEEECKGKLSPNAIENLHYAIEGATRMNSLIDGLLLYSRVGRQETELRQVNFEDILTMAIRNLGALASNTDAVITHSPLPKIEADETQMVQLFQNLIGNAIKFQSHNKPIVHIEAHEREKDWLFSVKDNGIGIDAKYINKVFVVFKRLHTREKYPGTGIGLAVCKKIVERHGGKIWVESTLGEGSTFFFSLPKKGISHTPH